ncbi:MAG: DUF1015 domain-containing protein [Brumimicrobium sp.]|nr:DUF1015 domain-containing protein [Brumimicrobium sp.]
MAKLRPFKAVRPTRDKVQLVASRPIYTYKPSTLAAKMDENPFTFIHIIHPEYFEVDETRTAPNSTERFQKVKAKYEEFLNEGILIQDSEPTYYVYRQTKGGHAFLGVIAGASIEEYEKDLIKKHEATLTLREEMFTNYLDIVGINAEPVLLSHRKSHRIDDILEKITAKRPEYEFTTTDLITHELWVATKEEMESLREAYEEIEYLYIADGHHRSASSVRLAERKRAFNPEAKDRNFESFLSFFIDEERLQILPFHRLCKSLNGLSSKAFFERLQHSFNIKKLDERKEPQSMHCIHMYFEREWFSLEVKKELLHFEDTVSSIDAEILTRKILSPILGIHDLKTDENIEFLSGNYGLEKFEQLIDDGVYKVGFVLYPVTMDQVKAVADENAVMPPKSTWVEPKLRSGLTIYTIDE